MFKPSLIQITDNTNIKSNTTKKVVKKQAIKVMDTYRDQLNEIPVGPLMIKLPGGVFKMGSKSPYSDERPQHEVELEKFSISKYEVTFEEYDWFAGATGRQLPDNNNWGRGKRPVINISWYNAVAYTEWLTEQTGYIYRLPSEREWEYAASANSETTYWWGYKLEKNYANCAICGSEWDGRQTAPVGSFKGNDFGLHDVIGNVMEWTISCFRPNYQDAPNTGNIWEWKKHKCLKRVVRSSSYKSYERELRTSKRNKFSPNEVSSKIGFRVVREE
ncbi:MAG: formylglycine-generating enzyme family protein [Proteobacteria bacterium]|nr:formylglycine-generating enzyme family protein [Pseudomonadota bacterium]